jgi:cytochrome c peroxidase
MRKAILFCGILVLTFVAESCKKNSATQNSISSFSATPSLPETPYDYSDRLGSDIILGNNEIITLGRVLFYDRNLSASGNISCGTCHKQEKGFADNVQFHSGISGKKLTRNTLSITGNSNALFWDGRASSLQELSVMPIQNHNEMGMNLKELIRKINSLPYYNQLLQNAFGANEIDDVKLKNSLAFFCSVLSAAPISAFDTINFTNQERLGFRLFHSAEAKCSSCHDVTNSTRNGYFNFIDPADIGLDIDPQDEGIASITKRMSDKGKFKIPNLRNVALTAPYMHDGRFNTLEEVVEHYNSGVKPSKNLSDILKDGNRIVQTFTIDGQTFTESVLDSTTVKTQKLNLTEEKKQALVAFLKKLTDNTITTDYRLSDPFRK